MKKSKSPLEVAFDSLMWMDQLVEKLRAAKVEIRIKATADNVQSLKQAADALRNKVEEVYESVAVQRYRGRTAPEAAKIGQSPYRPSYGKHRNSALYREIEQYLQERDTINGKQ